MSFLWTADALAATTGGRWLGDCAGVTGISIDTRSLLAGDLFIALAGENHDAHDFVADALGKGAGAAIVSRIPRDVSAEAPLLLVDDIQTALEALGHAGRARSTAKVIAVTGSVGKTSTKEMLHTMLAGQIRVHAAVKSFNNHWGVPITLARMPEETEVAVIEIGMNHPGEITPLSKMAAPDVTIITTVEAVHLAAFDGIEQIADAKAEIFAGLAPDGIAILNRDNNQFDRLAAQAPGKIVTFGRNADLKLIKTDIRGESTAVEAEICGNRIAFEFGVAGAHFAMNAVAALGAVEAVGADVAAAAHALAGWTPPDGRGRRERISLGAENPGAEITLIDDSYNANPASMRAALAVLAATEVGETGGGRGRRVAFLGDMLELGPGERYFHAALAQLPEIAGIDIVHSCGPLMAHMHQALPQEKRGTWAENSAELAAGLQHCLDAGDVCMVKGSLGSKMAVVVKAIHARGQTASAQEA